MEKDVYGMNVVFGPEFAVFAQQYCRFGKLALQAPPSRRAY